MTTKLETPNDVLWEMVYEGEKVRMSNWAKGEYIHMVDGYVRDHNGSRSDNWNYISTSLAYWEIYKEPQKRTFYRRKWLIYERGQLLQPPWFACSSKEAFDAHIKGLSCTEFSEEWEEIEI